jgi:hypothetical protein
VPLLLATAGIGGTVAIARGAPWIDAKVMAITSALVLCASAAAVAAARRPVAAAGLVVIAGFSAWSTALVLRDVFVAPRSELAQQRSIGRALEGHGPTLVLSFEGLANRYLFAPARAEGASDARSHVVTDRAGTPPADFTTVEMGDVDPKVFASFNAILRRRTPVGSWAPADFRPFATTTAYESWLRVPGAPAPLADLPLGSGLPAGVPDCAAVRQLAATPGATTLAAAPRANPVLGAPGQLTVPTTGVWRAWVQGETLGRLEVRIDGVSAGSYRHRIVATGGWLRFGARRLAAGPHTVTLRSERGAFWRAGRGTSASQPPLGGVALSPESPQTVERMPVERARRLCDGRSYDWIEALP